MNPVFKVGDRVLFRPVYSWRNKWEEGRVVSETAFELIIRATILEHNGYKTENHYARIAVPATELTRLIYVGV